ncbi:Oidioi.mRNA.OKI2018_I69.PAR.g8791.t1.cds [Oikopleura dioica]|uniref:Oidioi.mRNA.OKI2018_I69.PAR.g8791.t1.cds n=1 Tax=Oikopleura dioica TaxID=34765 RepID=A0ABN7RHK5_OIKDI|nr:Oidioi.mRNA.OKI2018_I69.PAR.g8791.t1.cds [Oikopleura dioica]
MVLMMLMSLLTDTMRRYLPTPTVRKIFFSVSSILTVLFMVGITFYPCWENFIFISIMICCFLCSAILTCACKPIANEMGGKYAAQIYAFSNSISQIAGIIAPILIGRMLSKGPIDQFETWINPGLSVIAITVLGMIGFQLATLTLLPFTSDTKEESKLLQENMKNIFVEQ